MKNKNKIIYILISIIVILSISLTTYYFLNKGSSSEKINTSPKKEDNQKEQITPLMYEITKDGSNNKIYLFGSIHAANLDEFSFPDYIMNAYQKSHYVACEADIVAYQNNQAQILLDTFKLLYQDNTTIKNHLKEETYNKLVDFLKKNNSYISSYDNYQPFFFNSLIASILVHDAKLDENDGIDAYFLKLAKKDNKKILEIESVEYQTNLFLDFKDELYDIIFQESLDNYDNEIENLKKLYQAWKKGNVEELLKISDDEIDIQDNYTKEQINLINDYNQKVVIDRNQNMTNKLINYFDNNQDVFYMVGVLHLIGDDGIAKLLENKGYNVKKINNSVNS